MSADRDKKFERIAQDPDLESEKREGKDARKDAELFYDDANKAHDLKDRELRRQIKSDALDSLKDLQKRLFIFTYVWLAAVFVVIIIAGFEFKGFVLDSDVLKIMVGSPIATMIGAIVINLKGAFSLLHRD